MRMWEYVLKADNQLDLADLDRATDWLHERPWCPDNLIADEESDAQVSQPKIGIERPFWRNEWCENLWALRSLAKRIRKKRIRHDCSNDRLDRIRADQVLNRYLGRLRLVVRPAHTRSKKVSELTQRTYKGTTISPTIELPDGSRDTRWIAADKLLDLDVFWQIVFGSFAMISDGPHFCEDCGCMFPDLTKTGRPSKRRVCSPCSLRRWKEKTPRKQMRQKWRNEKSRQRAN